MHYQPKYLTFIKRLWIQVYKTMLLYFVVILGGALISSVNVLNAMLIGFLPVCIILLTGAFYTNRYYLKQINIDQEQTKLIINKFDKEFKVYNIRTEDLTVRINQIFFSYIPYYKLHFYEGKKLIHKQYESSQWTIKLLVDVYTEIKQMRGEQAHTNWIKI